METIETSHEQLVRRLVKSPATLFKQITPLKVALIHSVLGIAGELGELEDVLSRLRDVYMQTKEDRLNLLEETGDFFFYARDIRHTLGLSPFVSVTVPARYIPAVDVGDIVDIAKGVAIYNKTVTPESLAKITASLNRLESYYEHELVFIGYTRKDSLEHNTHKLNIRYPAGYSDAAAEARLDKKPLDLNPNLHDG